MFLLTAESVEIMNSLIVFAAPQRSGTKAFGSALGEGGLKVLSWKQNAQVGLSKLWYERRIEDVVEVCSGFDVIEDHPGYDREFVRLIGSAFPNSKFVALYRDPDDWFESLVAHSDGYAPGKLAEHALMYGRSADLVGRAEPLPVRQIPERLDLTSARRHYLGWYRDHRASLELLNSSGPVKGRIFVNEWSLLNPSNLANFLDLNFTPSFPPVHATPNKADKLEKIYRERGLIS